MSELGSVETGRIAAKLEGTIEITLTPAQGCAACGLCSRGKDNSMRLIVKDPGNTQTGQAVRITLPRNSQWKAMFYCFVLPLILFFAGGAAGQFVASRLRFPPALTVISAAAGAFAGMLGGYMYARVADRRFARKVFAETRVEVMP